MSQVFDLDNVDDDDTANPQAAEASDIQEFNVELNGDVQEGLSVTGLIGPSESIQERCRREGAKHVEIPLGTDPRMKREGRIDTVQLGSICNTIMATFDRLHATFPELSLDHLRAAVITEHPEIEKSGFFYRYAGLFMTFTNPDISSHERMKCMQTILLKHKLEKGDIDGEEANECLGDLMGVSGERRKKLYNKLREIHLEEERRRKQYKKGGKKRG